MRRRKAEKLQAPHSLTLSDLKEKEIVWRGEAWEYRGGREGQGIADGNKCVQKMRTKDCTNVGDHGQRCPSPSPFPFFLFNLYIFYFYLVYLIKIFYLN